MAAASPQRGLPVFPVPFRIPCPVFVFPVPSFFSRIALQWQHPKSARHRPFRSSKCRAAARVSDKRHSAIGEACAATPRAPVKRDLPSPCASIANVALGKIFGCAFVQLTKSFELAAPARACSTARCFFARLPASPPSIARRSLTWRSLTGDGRLADIHARERDQSDTGHELTPAHATLYDGRASGAPAMFIHGVKREAGARPDPLAQSRRCPRNGKRAQEIHTRPLRQRGKAWFSSRRQDGPLASPETGLTARC